jgi:hypothetical protein
MKKRILSLILAVCMVAVAIPALLLPVVAADTTGFTTKFSTTENWPSFTPGKSFDGWNGNWSVGYYDAGNYADFQQMSMTYNILNGKGGDSQWETTGLYLTEGRFITLAGSGEPYMTGEGPTKAFAITYNAPYEGTVDLSLESIAADSREDQIPSGETASLYFAVFVNDVMVFPTTGASVLDPSAFALVSALSDIENDRAYSKLKNVEVNIGDRISFVTARYNTRYGTMVPVVTYHDGYELVPSRWQQTYGPASTTWPKARNLSGSGLLTQTDPLWTLAGFNAETKTVTEYGAQYRNTIASWAGIDREHVDFTNYNGIVIMNNGALNGSFMLNDTSKELPAYVGTALATGKLEFSAKASSLYLAGTNANAQKNGEATIDVYVNNEKQGSILVKSDSKGNASLVSTVKDVPVQKGDTIMYVAASASAKTKFINVQPNLIYTDITSFMTKTTTEKYDMEMDEASIVVDGKIGLQFNAYATVDTYRDATSADVYLWDATVTGEKTLANATAKIPMAVNNQFAYTAVYNTFTPKEMADTFTAQVVVLKGEETICQSEPKTFSVADAAQAQYDASYDQDEKDLMVAVMNYGAYAQKYFKYNTENLANKALPEFLTTIDIEKYQYFSKFDGQMVGAATLLTYSELDAFSLYLEDTISIRLYINIDPYEKAVAEDMYVQFGGEDDYADNNNGVRLPVDRETGAALIENITLNDLSEVYYLRFVSVERTTTGTGTSRVYRYLGYTWTYSVESFAARMMDSTEANLPELLCALMELGKLA